MFTYSYSIEKTGTCSKCQNELSYESGLKAVCNQCKTINHECPQCHQLISNNDSTHRCDK